MYSIRFYADGILKRIRRIFSVDLDGVWIKFQDEKSDETSADYEAAFVCTPEGHGKIELHFTTEREPVAYLLIGSLKAIAQIYYNTTAVIEFNRYQNDPRHFR